MNPFTLITKSGYGIIRKNKAAQTLIKEAMEEGISVAKRLGIKLYFNPYEIVRSIQYGKMNNFQYRGSMYYDIIKRKRTELDFITGEIINQASKLGIKVPTLKTIYQIAKIIEKNILD
jgi:2-dehydropantoate 2-reductase